MLLIHGAVPSVERRAQNKLNDLASCEIRWFAQWQHAFEGRKKPP